MNYLLRYYSIILIYILISTGFSFGNNTIFIQDTDTINNVDSNNIKQGWWRTYFDSKSIREEGIYINNKKQGKWISYYESGIKKSEIKYNNGEPKGTATFYYKNGKVREKGNWEIDHWVGNYKYYYENGQISYNWNYNEDGHREGEQLYFHENGNKMYEGVWNDGKTNGKLLVFNEQGKLVQEKIYANGKMNATNTIQSESSTGIASIEENKETDNIPRLKFQGTGNHTIINENGKIAAKGFFVKGSLFNGERFNYDEKDQLISITYYKNGKITETKPK